MGKAKGIYTFIHTCFKLFSLVHKIIVFGTEKYLCKCIPPFNLKYRVMIKCYLKQILILILGIRVVQKVRL